MGKTKSKNRRSSKEREKTRPKRRSTEKLYNPKPHEEIENFHYTLVDGERVYEVTGIVDERVNDVTGNVEFLCSFRNFCALQNTWTPFEEIKETAKEVLKEWERTKLKKAPEMLKSFIPRSSSRTQKYSPAQDISETTPKKSKTRRSSPVQDTPDSTPKKPRRRAVVLSDSSSSESSSDEDPDVPTTSRRKRKRTSEEPAAQKRKRLPSSDSEFSRPPSPVESESSSTMDSFVAPDSSDVSEALDTSTSSSSSAPTPDLDDSTSSETPDSLEVEDEANDIQPTPSPVPVVPQKPARETSNSVSREKSFVPKNRPAQEKRNCVRQSTNSDHNTPSTSRKLMEERQTYVDPKCKEDEIEGVHYIMQNGQRCYTVADILDDRKIKDDEEEFFVRFQNFGPQHNTWLPANNLQADEKLKQYWEVKKKEKKLREKFPVSASFNLGSNDELSDQITERLRLGETFLAAIIYYDGEYKLVRNYISGSTLLRQPKKLVSHLDHFSGAKIVNMQFTEAEDAYLLEVHTLEGAIALAPDPEERERLGLVQIAPLQDVTNK